MLAPIFVLAQISFKGSHVFICSFYLVLLNLFKELGVLSESCHLFYEDVNNYFTCTQPVMSTVGGVLYTLHKSDSL